MNSKIFERLKSLFAQLSAELAQKSTSMAELKGYCAGLSLAQNDMDEAYANLFVDTAGEKGLGMLLSLVGEDKRDTDEESREAVINAFSNKDAIMSYDSFFEELKKISEDADFYCNGYAMLISHCLLPERDVLKRLSHFIKNFVPANVHIYLNGVGARWEFCEYLGLHWYEIDELALPFTIWETMNNC